MRVCTAFRLVGPRAPNLLEARCRRRLGLRPRPGARTQARGGNFQIFGNFLKLDMFIIGLKFDLRLELELRGRIRRVYTRVVPPLWLKSPLGHGGQATTHSSYGGSRSAGHYLDSTDSGCGVYGRSAHCSAYSSHSQYHHHRHHQGGNTLPFSLTVLVVMLLLLTLELTVSHQLNLNNRVWRLLSAVQNRTTVVHSRLCLLTLAESRQGLAGTRDRSHYAHLPFHSFSEDHSLWAAGLESHSMLLHEPVSEYHVIRSLWVDRHDGDINLSSKLPDFYPTTNNRATQPKLITSDPSYGYPLTVVVSNKSAETLLILANEFWRTPIHVCTSIK